MCDSFKRNFLFESLEVPYEVIEDGVTLITSGSILKKSYEPKEVPLVVTEDVGDLSHDYEDCPEDKVGVEKCQVLRWKSFTVN